MMREDILLEKETGLRTNFQGEERSYVRRLLVDVTDPNRHLECRVLDVEDIPNAIGEAVTLEVIRAITDRRSGIVRFDCRLIQTTR
jgi:hypothetical protein